MPRRGPLPKIRLRPCRRRCGRSRARDPATSSSSCRASATSARRPAPCGRTAPSTCCPSTRASTTPSRSGSFTPANGAGWCSRRTWRRPRSPCPASGSWSIPGSPASVATATAPRSSDFPSSQCRARPPSNVGAGAGGSDPACACDSSPERTTPAGHALPRPKSAARTSLPSSSGWRRAGSAG